MPTPQLSVPSPGPRWISFVSLFLRTSIGFHLLRIGVASYHSGLVTSPGQRRPSFLLPPTAPNFLFEVFQYLAIAFGLALVLGFLTRFAAAAVGVMLVSASALQLVLEVKAGVPTSFGNNPVIAIEQLGTVQVRQYMGLQLLILIWIAGSVNNLYSLDGLMFLKKRIDERPRANTGPTTPLLTGVATVVVDSSNQPSRPAADEARLHRDLDFSDPEFGVAAEQTRKPN